MSYQSDIMREDLIKMKVSFRVLRARENFKIKKSQQTSASGFDLPKMWASKLCEQR